MQNSVQFHWQLICNAIAENIGKNTMTALSFVGKLALQWRNILSNSLLVRCYAVQ